MRTATVALFPVCVLTALFGAVPVAQAQDDGVVYEPGTPSGKEYAIPLEEARREAGGALPAGGSSGPNGGAGDSAVAPFGIGIQPRVKAAGKPSSGAGSTTAGPVKASASDVAAAESADVGAIARLGLPLLLVLLPGLLVGLLLARRTRATPA